jgi:hypothetical protein
MTEFFDGVPVNSVHDLIDVATGRRDRAERISIICNEKRYIYQDMGVLSFSREMAAEHFCKVLGVDSLPADAVIKEEVI